MKIGMISLENRDKEPISERVSRAVSIIEENRGADLYMLPELWSVGFFAFDDYKAAARYGGGIIARLSEAAKSAGAYIFMGSIVEGIGDKLFNTAFLIDRSGEIIGKYSKAHLFGNEKNYMTAGNEYTVCDTEFGRVGFSICYDLRFPEQYRAMVDKGAEIFLNCSAWPQSRAAHWDILNRARAVENQALVLSCCSRGSDNGARYVGRSYAIAADGRVLLKSDTEYAQVSVNPAETKKYRAEFPVLCDKI